ncbi:MAG: hypothetical protein LBO64_02425 [Desulfovibrio sp.]|jgi:hypothetical protein|nr:hypothetical protein [Desulfovibrio sp.]
MQAFKKKIGGALLGALLIAAGLLLVPPLLEKKTETHVTEFLQKIPGGVRAQSVKADFWNKEVVLQGIAGTGKRLDGGEFTFQAEEIRIRDIKTGSPAASGPTRLFGLLRVRGLKIRSDIAVPGFEARPITQTITVGDLSLRDVVGDLNRLLQTYGAGREEFSDALASFRAGNVDMEGYAVSSDVAGAGSVLSTLDSVTGRDMSLLSSGPFEARGFKLNALGMDIALIGKMRAASASAPNVYRHAVVMYPPHDPRDGLRGLMRALETAPAVLRGMECEDIALPPDFSTGKRIHIAGTSVDLTLDTHSAELRVTLSGLTLPPEIYRTILFAAGFAQTYDKDLRLDAVLDVNGALEGKSGKLTVNRISLADTALASLESAGAFTFTVGGREGPEALFTSGADLFLKNFRVVIEDYALTDVLLAAFGNSPAMRATAVERLRKAADAADGKFPAKLLRGLAQLVAAPGRLSVAVNPAAPLPLPLPDSPDDMSETELRALNSGTSVEYTPR